MSCDVDIQHAQIIVHNVEPTGPIGCVADVEISQLQQWLDIASYYLLIRLLLTLVTQI